MARAAPACAFPLSCDAHVARIEQSPASLRTLELTDEISNILCSVIDVASVLQSLHPSESWRDAAGATAGRLMIYMTSLNHHAGLYRRISELCAMPDFRTRFTAEEQRVATTLKEEMDHTGIGCPPETRQLVSDLLNEVQLASQLFMETSLGASTEEGWDVDDAGQPVPSPAVRSPTHWFLRGTSATDILAQLPRGVQRHAQAVNGTTVRLPTHTLEECISGLPSASLRRQAYLAYNSAGRLAVTARALERVLRARHRLASTLGHSSFSAYTVSRCVARDPQHVRTFLRSILQTLQTNSGDPSAWHPRSLAEKHRLQLAKWALEQNRTASSSSRGLTAEEQSAVDFTVLRPWDQSYLLARARTCTPPVIVPVQPEQYFSVANVLRGFQILLSRLFAIEARQVLPTAEEDWTRDVQDRLPDELIKLELWEHSGQLLDSVQPNVGTTASPDARSSVSAAPSSASSSSTPRLIGVLYLDLYARPHKHQVSATFNVRSARQNFFDPANPLASSRDEAGNERLPRQTPVAGIMTTLPRPTYFPDLHASQAGGGSSRTNRVTLLPFVTVEMLFHELGHCLHNVLSLTRFQHVAGARGELDFVEMPSTLFERFVQLPEFVQQWARHVRTDEPIPLSTLRDLKADQQSFQFTAMMQQACLALFDQRIYSEEIKLDQAPAPTQPRDPSSTIQPHYARVETMQQLLRISQSIDREFSHFRPEEEGESGRPDASAPSSAASPLAIDSHPHPYLHAAHLLSYGSSYYSYLYCRIFAGLVWRNQVAASPLSPKTGLLLRQALFAPGGSVDPETLLRQLAGVPEGVSLAQFVESQVQPFLREAGARGTSSQTAL